MKYSNVFIETIQYELGPHIITTAQLEDKLEPLFENTFLQKGQLEILTGIRERRFWDEDHTLGEHAAKACQKALDKSLISADQIGALAYCGVCNDGFEPATACSVAHALNLNKNAHVYDVRNACLGVISGIIQIANEIELKNIKAGLVVSCESARQIVESTIDEMNHYKSVDFYKQAVATMTGGSAAVAVLLTDGSIGNKNNQKHILKGAVVRNAAQYHDLCHWGFDTKGMPTDAKVIMRTRAQEVLEYGIELAKTTFDDFKKDFNLPYDKPDKFIGHQVGALHHKKFYQALNIDIKKDFCTYPFLGNTGTAGLPITAAIADEKGFLKPNDFTAFIGVGSGLNCSILGVQW